MAEKELYAGVCKPGDIEEAEKELREVKTFLCDHCKKWVEGVEAKEDSINDFFYLKCPYCDGIKTDGNGHNTLHCSEKIKHTLPTKGFRIGLIRDLVEHKLPY